MRRIEKVSKRSRRLATLSLMGVTQPGESDDQFVYRSWSVDFTATVRSLAFQAGYIFPPHVARFLQ